MNIKNLWFLMFGLALSLGDMQAMRKPGTSSSSSSSYSPSSSSSVQQKPEEKLGASEGKEVKVTKEVKESKNFTRMLDKDMWWSIIVWLARTPDDVRKITRTSKFFALLLVNKTVEQIRYPKEIGSLREAFKSFFSVIDEHNGHGSLHWVCASHPKSAVQACTLWKQYATQKITTGVDEDLKSGVLCHVPTTEEELKMPIEQFFMGKRLSDISTRMTNELIRTDRAGFTPLQCAVNNRLCGVVQWLVANKVPIAGDDDKHPLVCALSIGAGKPVEEEVVNFLLLSHELSNFCNFRIWERRTSFGDTLVHAAITTRNTRLVSTMLAYFCNVPEDEGVRFIVLQGNAVGENALEYAQRLDDLKIIALFHEYRIPNREDFIDDIGAGEGDFDAGHEGDAVDHEGEGDDEGEGDHDDVAE